MCRDTSYVLFLFSIQAPGIASKDRIFLVGEHGPSNGACDVITLCFRFLHSKEEKVLHEVLLTGRESIQQSF